MAISDGKKEELKKRWHDMLNGVAEKESTDDLFHKRVKTLHEHIERNNARKILRGLLAK